MFAIKATLDKSRPIVCIIQKLTQLESRTQQEGNPHESETQIARLDKQTFSPQNIIGEHIVVRSQLGGTHHHAPTLESTLQCASTLVAPNFVATSSSRLWTKDNQPGASSHSDEGISS